MEGPLAARCGRFAESRCGRFAESRYGRSLGSALWKIRRIALWKVRRIALWKVRRIALWKANKTYLELSEGGDGDTLSLYSTVPFLCDTQKYDHCYIDIDIQVENEVSPSECKIQLFSNSWDPETHKAEAPGLHVYATEDGQIDGDQVRTKDEGPTGHCKGVTDPHYTTFDGTRFTILMLGEFYFYLSTIRRFEVQVRTWYCYGAHRYDVTCHCAVAVREGNNVVIIDLCHVGWGNHQNAYPRIIEKTADGGPLSEAVSVYRDQTDKKFSIHMESTATVVVEINRYGMDVHVYAPARDRGHTTGLCGTWDDQPDRSNDLQLPSGSFTTDVDTFANSWKIDQGTSLFDVDCPDVDPHAQRPVKTCTCQNGSIQYDIDESEGYVFDYGENQPPPPVVQWPTANLHITEEDAVRHCREAIINSSVSAACANLGVDIFDPVDACVQDIKLTEDLLIAAAHVDTMKATCTDVAYQNISLYEVGEDGIPVPSRAVQDNLCPEDCNHRGDCVKGTCVCLEPYTSADCSLEKGNTPVIRSIPNNGLCDIRRRPCRKTSIIADGLDSSNVTCKIVGVKTENGIQTIIQGSERLMNATIRTFLEASCPLPESPVLRGTPDETEGTDIYGYSVSVSNDGENFSNEVLLTIYDSVCQNCTLGPTCFWKLNTCKIRGFCFADGDPNPNNWCQQCLPQLSSNTFTDRPINIPPTIVSPTTITKVRGNHLDFAVITDDPEGRPVTVSIISANSNDITVNGDQFEWRTDQEVGSFVETFKASDECGAFSTHNVTFITIACPCQNNGTCVHNPNMPSGQGQYVCECPGFTGHWCEQEIDECLSNPCHTGTCIDLVNGFKCLCDEQHVGEFCHIEQGDNCALEPCFHSVPCINVGSGFECGDCPEGFIGNGIICEDVDECATNTANDCSNICENTPGSYRCKCAAGFILSNGQCFDLDECDYGLSLCSHICINTNGSYICDCPAGYYLGPKGKNCIEVDECASDPCQHGGSCLDGINQFNCKCPLGWLGAACEKDIDECLVTNCEHSCENTPGSYSCRCPEGYMLGEDKRTCTDRTIMVVSSNKHSPTVLPCLYLIKRAWNRAKSSNSCDIDECASSPCLNGGTCSDGDNSYTCQCLTGYYGNNCEHDIDLCDPNPCPFDWICIENVGVGGLHCDPPQDIDECASSPCLNGGTCSDGDNSFTCQCVTGYDGDNCEHDTNGCASGPCVAVATCTDILAPGTGAICTCPAGYQGDGKIHSSGCTDIPGCDPNPCVTTAFCVDVSAPGTGAECICPDGYEGDGALGGIGCKAVPATSQMWEPWKIALLCVGLLGAVFVTISLSLYLCCRCKKNPLCKSATNEDEMPIKGFENPTSHRTNHGMDLEVSEC
ncbi:hypothetical protein Bbelb_132890 [Branchiostoma belcheri]|nr:hypothetical protein Bbelb_132890 [Branchiostoma belcheri]